MASKVFLENCKNRNLDSNTIFLKRRHYEQKMLREKILEEILYNATQRYSIQISAKEIEKLALKKLREQYKREDYSYQDIINMNIKNNRFMSSVLRLLSIWREDKDAGEKLYKKEFSKEITPYWWGKYKNIYASKKALKSLKEKFPLPTDEEALKMFFIKHAKYEFTIKVLYKKLSSTGIISGKTDFVMWIYKQLAEFEILRSDFSLSYENLLGSIKINLDKELSSPKNHLPKNSSKKVEN